MRANAWTRFAQIVIIAAPIAAFGWLLVQELVLSGVFRTQHEAGERSPFIDPLVPDARVGKVYADAAGDRVRTVIDEPAFFFAHPHRGFDEVEVEAWMKRIDAPVIELGGLARSENGEAYDLKPLYNEAIESSDWERIERDGTVLLQRDPRYESIDAFQADPPARSRVATYHAGIDQPFRLPAYQPLGREREIDASLRGFHELQTYIKDETLRFELDYTDMNRDEGADPVRVILFDDNGRAVRDARAGDDGVERASRENTGVRTISLSAEGLPEGAYKLELRAGRDIFFRRIRTPQRYVVALNALYLGDEVGWQPEPRQVRVWTEAPRLTLQTHHAEGVQEVASAGASVVIDEPFSLHVLTRPGRAGEVRFGKGDIIVSGNGHYAFSEDAYFNPDPVRLAPGTDPDAHGVDYILAAYTPPERVGEWIVGRAAFDASVLELEEGSWKFAFSVPEMKEHAQGFDIGRIRMVWRREPFSFADLWEGLKGLF